MEDICYFNGKVMPTKDANVGVRDLGFLRGYGVFDVLPVVNGKPFLIVEHWARLERSAREIGLQVSLLFPEAEKIMLDLIAHHSYEHMIVRTVLTGGPSEGGFLPEGDGTLAIMIEETKPLPEMLYRDGGSVITMEHMRAFPTAKTTNYVFPISHRKVKDAAGVLEILYTCGGDVLEASTSNVFIVKDGAIRTPKDDVLIGITRNLVLRLAGELGIGTSEGAITSEEFFSADEAFLTASNKRVVPVVRADGNPIGGGSAGPVTNRLHGAISGFMEAY